MIVDPILKRLVAKAYLNGFGNLHLFTPEQMRESLRPRKFNVEKASYQDFLTDHGITLRCYWPNNANLSTVLPGVLYISANAYVLNRLDSGNDYCSLLANTLQMKIISVSHRLIPENKFPRFSYDCRDSIKWVYQNASLLSLDKDKLSLWGESSGGNIAAACTHLLRDEGLPIIKYQTLFYPMMDLITPFPSKTEYEYGYMLDKGFIQWLKTNAFHQEEDQRDPLASPLFSTSFENLPPTTLITAECDPLRDEGEAYAEKLKEAKVPVAFKRFDGMIHCFMRFYPKVSASQDALAFASTALKQFMNNNSY
ncbi:MAG: alpha/beta hydrolase [Proteobacteria bacterium]|nr:alpha/beta hydrolase [Pseudomonadota bacterium]